VYKALTTFDLLTNNSKRKRKREREKRREIER